MVLAQKQPEESVSGVAGQVSPKEDITKLSKVSKEVAKGAVEFSEREVKLRDGGSAKLQSIKIREMVLYHGATMSGIKELKEAEDTTMGDGLYLTSSKKAATGYSFVRALKDEKHILYETMIENMDILNLSTPGSVREFMKFYVEVLSDELKTMDSSRWAVRENYSRTRDKVYKALQEGRILNPKEMLQYTGATARNRLMKLGYDGIFAIEGGGGDVGDHDSFVIFDPKRVKVVEEREVTKEMV